MAIIHQQTKNVLQDNMQLAVMVLGKQLQTSTVLTAGGKINLIQIKKLDLIELFYV